MIYSIHEEMEIYIYTKRNNHIESITFNICIYRGKSSYVIVLTNDEKEWVKKYTSSSHMNDDGFFHVLFDYKT